MNIYPAELVNTSDPRLIDSWKTKEFPMGWVLTALTDIFMDFVYGGISRLGVRAFLVNGELQWFPIPLRSEEVEEARQQPFAA